MRSNSRPAASSAFRSIRSRSKTIPPDPRKRTPHERPHAAARAVTEAGIYGGGPGIRAIAFFRRAGRAVDAGAAIEEVVSAELATRRILGYGRPIDSHDERLPSLVALAQAQGLDGGRHY